MDAADSLAGKSFAILFLSEQTAILFKPGIELLDISGGKFVQWNGAQVWDDVLSDYKTEINSVWLFPSPLNNDSPRDAVAKVCRRS